MVTAYQDQDQNANISTKVYSDEGEVTEDRFVRLHRNGWLALVSKVEPYLLQTLIVLASYSNVDRQAWISSKSLADTLLVSRKAARQRIAALADLRVDGKPLVTVTMTRRHQRAPGRYVIKFSEAVPISCGGADVTEEIWVKHFDEARELAGKLSAGAHVTLLTLAVEMLESRIVRATYDELAERLGVVRSTAQDRIAELVGAGVIEKIGSPGGNYYRVREKVPLRFGGEDDPELWEHDYVDIELAPIPPQARYTGSAPHFKRVKELKKTNRILGMETEARPLVVDLSNEETKEIPEGISRKVWLNWIGVYGEDRVSEVIEAAKGKKNPGGWARSALEGAWTLAPTKVEMQGACFWRIDQKASDRRAMELAGEL